MLAKKKRTPKLTFEEAVQLVLGSLPGTRLSAVAEQRIRADVRLQFDYPDCYVAYVDNLKGRGRNQTFHREIIAHASSLGDLHDQLDGMSKSRRTGVFFDYVLDPEGPIEVGPHEVIA